VDPAPAPATPPNPQSGTTVEPPAPASPTIDPDAVVDNWDGTPSPAPQPSTTDPVQAAVDYSELAKVLGTEVKSKEEALKVLSEYKTKVEEATSKLTRLPKELVKAMEIAEKQGNYLEYLKVSSVDWSKQDPVEVYEEYIIDRAKDEQGNVDFEKVEAFLEKMDDFEKEVRGKELIAAYQQNQRQMQFAIEQQAVEEAKSKEQGLRQALASIDNVSGFKLSPSHKEELFSWYTSGNMLRDMFYDQSGNLDFKKVVTTAFLNKYWEKVDSFRKQQIKNSVKRELLDELTNPSVRPTSDPALPPSEQPKGYTISDWLKELEKQKK
jgi:hypothetical protein